jgi:TctA family transporter
VLGPLVEKNFRLSLIISRGNPLVFASTWIDNLLWLLLVLFFVAPLVVRLSRRTWSVRTLGATTAR